MNELIIINATGYARTVVALAQSDSAWNKHWVIGGMLDTRTDIVKRDGDYPIIGDPFSYEPQSHQLYVCALGDPVQREKYSLSLKKKNANFINLLPNTHMGLGVKIQPGGIFERNTMIGSDSQLGESIIMHSFGVLGHDVVVGDYVTIGSLAVIGGGAKIGNKVTIFPHATILPGVKIGCNATIGAGSVVVKDVPPDVTVFGNPAKIIAYAQPK